MKNILSLGVVAGFAGLLVVGCGGGSNNNGSGGLGTGANGRTFTQRERLANPVVNEVFATVANNQHLINDTINPDRDRAELLPDVIGFMKGTAGRSDNIANRVGTVLVPDVMVVDLSKRTQASYLGVQTNGATGGTFGGRKLQDDVVDISLGIIFGTTISDLGLEQPDGKQKLSLASDNVGASKTYLSDFPYLPTPTPR